MSAPSTYVAQYIYMCVHAQLLINAIIPMPEQAIPRSVALQVVERATSFIEQLFNLLMCQATTQMLATEMPHGTKWREGWGGRDMQLPGSR